MNLGLIIFVVLLLITASALAASTILFWITKLFKIENPTYKKSLLIVGISTVVEWAIGALLALIFYGELELALELAGDLISSIAGFFVFYYVFKRFYPTSWKEILGVYVTLSVAIFVLALIVTGLIRFSVAEPFSVRGQAMSPTLNDGAYLIIDKLDTTFARGDIIIFRNPETQKEFSIKRITGLPGEWVEIKDGQVSINGRSLNELYTQGKTEGQVFIKLSDTQYFVLGDNRQESYDSRQFGAVQAESIMGKVVFNVSEWWSKQSTRLPGV